MLHQDGVGDLEDVGGFGLGVAPRNLKPQHKIELGKKKEEELAKMQADDDVQVQENEEDDESDSKLEIIRLKKQMDKKRKPIDKQQAFLEFKVNDGKQYEDQILSLRTDLKNKKLLVKELTEECNKCKREIDRVKEKID